MILNENLSGKTVGNAAILLVGAAMETLLQLAFLIVAGRQLGPSEFGFYGYLLAWVTIAAALAQFGQPVIGVREIAQRPQDESAIFSATVRIRFVGSLLLFLVAGTVAMFSEIGRLHQSAVWLAFAYLLFVPFDLSLFFDAHKMSRWDVPGRIIGRFLSVGLLTGLWQINGEITVADVALCSSLFLFFNAIVAWIVIHRLGFRLQPFAPTAEIRRLLRPSVPVTWSNLMTLAYSQSQTIFVKWFSTALETGYNALASRLFLPLLIFRGIVNRVLLPLISEVGTDYSALNARLERIFPALALVFIPTTVLAIPLVEILVVPIFGEEYKGAVQPLQILIAQLFFSGAGAMIGTSLLASGDARTPAVGLTIGCLCSVTLGILWIPAHGAVGAAWATLVGEFIAVFYPLPRFRRVLRPAVLPRMLLLALISLLSLAVYFLLNRMLNLQSLFALTAQIIFLFIGLRIIGELSPDRVRSLAGLFRPAAR